MNVFLNATWNQYHFYKICVEEMYWVKRTGNEGIILWTRPAKL